jgi:hypothetical protein
MEIMMSAVRNTSARSMSEGSAAENALSAGPVEIFQGYNSVDGAAGRWRCMGTPGSYKARLTCAIKSAKISETLSQTLDINQSLSISFGPVGSFDEKMKFVRNLKTTTCSISIVVYARQITGAKTMTDVWLKEGVKPPAPGDNDDLIRFYRTFGDSFVSSITEGGEYYATYTFYSQSQEEQTELEASMKAAGVFDGGKMDAELQTKLSEFVSRTKVDVAFYENVSGLSHPLLPKREEMIEYARAFPSLRLDAPAIIAFETSGYESVGGITTNFDPIAKNRLYFTGDGIYGGLTPQLVEVQHLLRQISSLKNIYEFYGGFTDDKVKEVDGLAQTDLETIHSQMLDYKFDPTKIFKQPTLKSLEAGTPVLHCQIDTRGNFGTNVNQFNDVADLGATNLRRKTRISKLNLRSGVKNRNPGRRVGQLMTTYQYSRDDQRQEEVRVHGDNWDLDVGELKFYEGQFITKIIVRCGADINYLQFTLNDGRSLSAGSADGGGDPELLETKPGQFILGFQASTDDILRSFGVVYATLKPAHWRPRRQRSLCAMMRLDVQSPAISDER